MPKLRTLGSGKPPILLHVRSSTWFILTTVSLAVFTDIFLYGVIVPVIPFSLSSRAGVSPDHVQYWVSVLLAVYGAALLAGSPFCGWFADHASTRRLPFAGGLLVLMCATVMLCVGNSIGILVAGRLLQGLSGAIVWTTGLALLVDTVGQKDVGQLMGYVGLAMSMGILVAPLLGGVVFDKAGYYAVFGMCFALIGVEIVLRLSMIEKKVAVKWLRQEASSLTIEDAGRESGTMSHTFQKKDNDEQKPVGNAELGSVQAIEKQEAEGSLEKQTTTDDAEDILSEDADQSSTDHPVHRQSSVTPTIPHTEIHLPPMLTLLKSRRLLAALWGSLVQASIFTAFDSVLPLYVRHIFGWNSLGAGLIFLPVSIPSFIGPLLGHFSDRYGPRYFAAAGFLMACPVLVLMRFVTYDSLSQKVTLCALLALVGLTATMTISPLLAEISYVVTAKEASRPGLFGKQGAYAQAYGLFNAAFAAGCMVGPLWGGMISEKAGWGTMTWTLGLLSTVTAVPVVLWVGGWIMGQQEEKRRERRATEKGRGDPGGSGHGGSPI